jgi:hypothetical protein
MPTQVYLVARRKEIQNGSLMVTDLFPNKSQANPTIDPQGQSPLYIKTPLIGAKVELATPVAGTSVIRFRAQGLVPFLIKNVQHGNNGSLSRSEALTAANLILDEVYGAGDLDEASINAILAVATNNAGTVLDDGAGGSLSVARVEDILRILSGETYEVSANTKVEEANVFIPDVTYRLGFKGDQKHLIPGDDSWQISLREGVLKGLTTVVDSEEGDLFAGVRSTQPLLSVYEVDGSLQN